MGARDGDRRRGRPHGVTVAPLLVAEDVTKRLKRGSHSVLALHAVSLAVDAGEFVTIRGLEPHGRTALTLVLAGLAPPDSGTVRFDGLDVYRHRHALVPSEIAVCWDRFPPSGGGTLLAHVALPLRLSGATRAEANDAAREALEHVEAGWAATRDPADVERGVLARAAIARAIMRRPRLVLANDLTTAVDLIERTALMALLRSLSSDQGMSVVVMTAQLVRGRNHVLEIQRAGAPGEALPPERPQAEVFPLRRARP